MKKKPNWKTSLAGLVAAIATAITPALSHQWQPVSTSVAGLATAIGLLCAKDAGNTPPADPPAGG